MVVQQDRDHELHGCRVTGLRVKTRAGCLNATLRAFLCVLNAFVPGATRRASVTLDPIDLGNTSNAIAHSFTPPPRIMPWQQQMWRLQSTNTGVEMPHKRSVRTPSDFDGSHVDWGNWQERICDC